MNMQTPPDVHDKQTLSRLMDGEWHDLDRSACVAALCRDPELRAAWARWHVARDALRGEPVMPAPADLAGRIGAAIAAEPAYSNVTALPGAPTVDGDAAGPRGDAADSHDGAERAERADPVGASDAAPVPVAAPVAAGRGGARVSRLGLTGFALAASAALVTVVGLDAWQGAGAPEGPGPVSGAGAGDASSFPATAALRVDESLASVLAPHPAPPRTPLLAPLPEVDLVANTGGAAVDSGSYWVAGDSGVRRGAAERRLNAFLSQHIESSPTVARQGMLPYSRLVGYDEAVGATAGAGAAVAPGAAATGAGAER